MNNKKVIIIINGKGGIGKDTLCNFASKYYDIENISSITPIKHIAELFGVDLSDKDKVRKDLSDLKKKYKTLARDYIDYQYKEFCKSNKQILFIHIREPEEIKWAANRFKHNKIVTLLIDNEEFHNIDYDNSSDNDVYQYTYNFIFNNIRDDKSEYRFIKFINDNIIDER